jgi:hypothetical protein
MATKEFIVRVVSCAFVDRLILTFRALPKASCIGSTWSFDVWMLSTLQ